ncbi:PTPA-domain-containing protein [Lentinus tigrinus ALCF2SS1-7]|uniref:Serine/threonine-protein phosphatase 2A activator n=1 Tax=Lentinus tigrinus ALCF2SS1-6 TaxID=1328759 RepID=A0A5C2RVW2_9APHY|nr:PTPA-domain-containing protein [Lentinus tigrinus ALCF2SS1-6]RPD69958.1 PTPA-domain-containing protein [Lentinus tigrinus ALCF2SS1-7]
MATSLIQSANPSSTSATAAAAADMSSPSLLPPLRRVEAASLAPADTPVLRIKTDEDVEAWKHTRGYQDYGLFLRRLAESVVGHTLPYEDPEPDAAASAIIAMLDTLDGWIDEIPPLPTPQRFGNLAFRTWGKRLEQEAPALLSALLPGPLHPTLPFIEPYLLTAFGSFTRMDYGTGHETSFALFLLCLALLRFVEPVPRVERQLVLNVFVRYVRLCWRLQDVYKLEPAGSHGVWGLDDYSFLTYVFGSAQLRDQKDIPVDAILHPPLPPTNLYFMSITRIDEVKSGPFHEHSSQLYAIATGVQHWSKVHSGLFKMYEAEVLGKRVVVQHIPLGGLLVWDVPGPQPHHHASHTSHAHASHASHSSHAPTPAPFVTPAPWAITAAPAAMSNPYTTPNRGSPLPFTAHTSHPGAARHPHRGGTDGLIPARAPLGPTASTALRPSMRSGGKPGTMGPPPPPQTSQPGGEE